MKLARDRLLQDVGHERALPAPRDSGDGDEARKGKLHIKPLEVVLARPLHHDALPAPLPSRLRNLHGAISADECTGD